MAELNTGWSSGFQQGMQLGQQRLRMQELRSLEAKRRFDERVAVEELTMKLEEHRIMVQERAEAEKAMGVFQALTMPTIPGPGGIPIPNPMKVPTGTAAMQAFLPVTRDPVKRMNIVAAAGLANERETMDATEQALVKQREASAALSAARTKQIQEGVPAADSEFIKTINALAERGVNYTPEELRKMHDIKAGLLPRAGTVTIPSEAAFLDEHIDKVMEQPAIEETITTSNLFGKQSTETKRRRPKSREEAKAYLRKEYQDLYGRSAEPAADTGEVWVINPAGKRGKIPKADLEKALKQGYKLFEG